MKKIPPFVFSLIFFIGALSGLALTTLATWADLEAAFYGFDRTGGDRLSSMRCPILMSANETSSFSVKVTNREDKKISPTIKTDVSTPGLPVSSFDPIELAPGESKRMEFQVGPDNIDLGRFVFARAWVYAAYPMDDLENTCGIFVVDLPVSGAVLTWGLLLMSLLGMGIGLYGRRQAPVHVRGDMSRLTFLAVIVFIGMLLSFLGWWVQGLLVLVVSVLALVIILSFAIRSN
jgi:hypothetical protein